MDRLEFQRQQVSNILNTTEGIVLNIGCNEDPGGIKDLDPDRVINCDLFAWDDVMDRPNYVDVLFDAAEDRWPFDDQEAEAVLLGDILEHLTHLDQVCVLNEARRVSKKLIITVPDDDRPETFQDRSHLPKGAVHVIHVTDQHLRSLLEDTGWTPEIFDVIDYGFVPAGYCVVAR